MNPLLPAEYFIPDVEAREWKDGRLYLYGSFDLSGQQTYCSDVYHVFSSPDMVQWTDHGVSFRSEDIPWAEGPLYAPDCIYRDGMYYLYFCMAANGEGVAVSRDPQGPFTDPVPVETAHGDSIDPAVFIDDDGTAYYLWGQFHLRGAILEDDMKTLRPGSAVDHIIEEEHHGFHEGASLRKYKDTYLLSYTDISRGRASCIGYATSKHPLGPYKKGGIILDNTGCDAGTWNNHGSLAEFQGKWYLFYHRSSQNSQFSRRVCVEPVTIEERDGDLFIHEILMTTQGAEPPLNPRKRISAAAACQIGGTVRTKPIGIGEECLEEITDGCTAAYRYFNFDNSVRLFHAEVQADGDFRMEIRFDGQEGEPDAVLPVSATDGIQPFFCKIKSISGVRECHFTFRGLPDKKMNLYNFWFSV